MRYRSVLSNLTKKANTLTKYALVVDEEVHKALINVSNNDKPSVLFTTCDKIKKIEMQKTSD